MDLPIEKFPSGFELGNIVRVERSFPTPRPKISAVMAEGAPVDEAIKACESPAERSRALPLRK